MGDQKRVDAIVDALLTENFSDTLARAEAGDVIEAKEALFTIAALLSPDRKDLETGESLPIPDYVKAYLSKSLYRMAGGEKADIAMNLQKNGRPKKWSHFSKRIAADLVFQLVEKGVSVMESAGIAADKINQIAAEKDPYKFLAWHQFRGKTIEQEILLTWYYELKDELTTIRKDL